MLNINRIVEESEREEWGAWKFVSDMLDNPNQYGIYSTSKCYEQIYNFVVEQKEKARAQELAELREKVAGMKAEQYTDPASNLGGSSHNEGYNQALSDILALLEGDKPSQCNDCFDGDHCHRTVMRCQCDCPKGGIDGNGNLCQKCGGLEWVEEKGETK